MTAVIALGIGIGAALGGFDVVTPVTGTRGARAVRARAGRASASPWAGSSAPRSPAEIIAAIVILTFVIDLLAPALKLPDWVHQIALTSHLGQPMIGSWDRVGMAACVAIAVGGLLLAGWGFSRRDIER